LINELLGGELNKVLMGWVVGVNLLGWVYQLPTWVTSPLLQVTV